MSPSEYFRTLEEKYGVHCMVESNLEFKAEARDSIVHQLMVEKQLPVFDVAVQRVNYEDGCKVYFTNGDFVICRFSGTEPLLRIFAESSTEEQAESYIRAFRELVAL